MVLLRFPFSFSQPTNGAQPQPNPRRHFSAIFAAAGVAAAVGGLISFSQNSNNPFDHNALTSSIFQNHSHPLWGSLSLAVRSAVAVESKTGVHFPSVIGESLRLLGVGLRKKSVLGLKNIDVYAFGVYADGNEIKELLRGKYGQISIDELKSKREFNNILMEADIPTTVRLQIIYSKLSIGSVRRAFEESVGSRLQKFGGPGNKELLESFTSQFKDEYNIPSGSVIELARERGHVLRTTIDGKETGRVQSKPLCMSILDLYIGENPFDKQAKEDVEVNVASFLPE